jgi:hypothetical protein
MPPNKEGGASQEVPPESKFGGSAYESKALVTTISS